MNYEGIIEYTIDIIGISLISMILYTVIDGLALGVDPGVFTFQNFLIIAVARAITKRFF